MSKIKRIIISIGIGIIALVGLSTTVNAATPTPITWKMYSEYGSRYFCAQKKQPFENFQKYDNIGTISIQGKTSTGFGRT